MKTISLYEFNRLDIDSKYSLVWEHGVFLMNRYEGNFKINLYSLFDFFIEIWYQSEMSSIEKIRTFKSLEALEPYLEKIKLDLKP